MDNLVLTVIKAPVDTLLNSFFKFERKSGTIGRGQSNDWILVDPECILSGKHLEIIYEQGAYRAKDTSSNGSFLYPSNEELDKTHGTLIQHEQVFEIGDFLLIAHLREAEVQQPEAVIAEPEEAIVEELDAVIEKPEAVIAEPEAKKLSPFEMGDEVQENSDDSNGSLEGTQEITYPDEPRILPSSPVIKSGIGENDSSEAHTPFSEPQSNSILGQAAPPKNSPLTQSDKQESIVATAENNLSYSDNKVPEDWDSDETVNQDINETQPIHGEGIGNASINSSASKTVDSSALSPEALNSNVLNNAPESTVGNSSHVAENTKVDVGSNDSIAEVQVHEPNVSEKEVVADASINTANSNADNGSAGGIKPPRPKPRPALSQPENTSPNLSGNEYQQFLNNLGLSGMSSANHSPELFAQIFSLVTEQLISILRSRNKVRQQFRLAVTSIQKSDNNPLTFSVNTDDAIHNLFVKQNAGYLPAMDSYEQAFSTIEHHQLAVVVGMRAGFENMLSAFSPESLSELKPKKKAKKWWHIFSSEEDQFEDNYDVHYKQLLKNKEQTFIQLFGEAFTHAYELSVHQHKSEEKLKKENV